MNTVITYSRYGGPEVLSLSEAAVPQPGPGQVRIRVKAVAVNPIDAKIRSGRLDGFFPARFPVLPGWDVAGVVDAAGEGASAAVGDEVFGVASPRRLQPVRPARSPGAQAGRAVLRGRGRRRHGRRGGVPRTEAPRPEGRPDAADPRRRRERWHHRGSARHRPWHHRHRDSRRARPRPAQRARRHRRRATATAGPSGSAQPRPPAWTRCSTRPAPACSPTPLPWPGTRRASSPSPTRAPPTTASGSPARTRPTVRPRRCPSWPRCWPTAGSPSRSGALTRSPMPPQAHADLDVGRNHGKIILLP